jgi:hypothetical protein
VSVRRGPRYRFDPLVASRPAIALATKHSPGQLGSAARPTIAFARFPSADVVTAQPADRAAVGRRCLCTAGSWTSPGWPRFRRRAGNLRIRTRDLSVNESASADPPRRTPRRVRARNRRRVFRHDPNEGDRRRGGTRCCRGQPVFGEFGRETAISGCGPLRSRRGSGSRVPAVVERRSSGPTMTTTGGPTARRVALLARARKATVGLSRPAIHGGVGEVS